MTHHANINLGTLKRLDPRTAWEREDTNFSAWLGQEDNLRLLSDAIGIELEFEAAEHRVGPFRADLRCKQLGSDRVIIIENQLERTDHSHLGQLLTYAAGERLVTVVWIAPQFRDEHRAAMDWLNEVTTESAEFFGIEIELWQIGESLPAPRFNVVARPNDWNRPRETGGGTEESTDRQTALLQFWTSFAELAKLKGSRVRPQKPRPQSWMVFALGTSDVFLEASIRMGKGAWKVACVADGSDRETLVEFLKSDVDRLQSEIGSALEWHSTSAGKSIQIRTHGTAPDLENAATWPAVHQSLLSTLERFHAAFASRVAEFKRAIERDRVPTSSPSELDRTASHRSVLSLLKSPRNHSSALSRTVCPSGCVTLRPPTPYGSCDVGRFTATSCLTASVCEPPGEAASIKCA